MVVGFGLLVLGCWFWVSMAFGFWFLVFMALIFEVNSIGKTLITNNPKP